MSQKALISVSDKTGLLPLAHALIDNAIEILSTGGTAQYLQSHNIRVTDVSEYTRFPEIMGGRVKTLHPKIHGGILARIPQDQSIMEICEIECIDYVIVNLYPFKETIAKPECSFEEAIENIDIGGPSLIRAAAKNFTRVCVCIDPSDYALIIDALNAKELLSLEQRKILATKAFAQTAQYDALIHQYLSEQDTDLPSELLLSLKQKEILRYGENNHQKAGLYVLDQDLKQTTLAQAPLLQGKALSYNNLADSDAAWSCLLSLDRIQKSCVIVKHANPCGVATADTLEQAYQKAYASDPVSAFGGVIALSDRISASLANIMIAQQFIEVILAPAIDEEALAIFATKPNIRVLCLSLTADRPEYELKAIGGGYLLQTPDQALYLEENLHVVTLQHPTQTQWLDLKFAWTVAKYVKSNAIVYAKNGCTLGIGAGQMSRVDSARIAALKSEDTKLSLQQAVMASDAFFPFADGIETAAAAGIQAVIQPGGSMRDAEIIARADELQLAMVFTGMRHFKH